MGDIGGRVGEVKRVTKETNVHVEINLDGNAVAENNTGIPFLDHMLDVSFVSVSVISYVNILSERFVLKEETFGFIQ